MEEEMKYSATTRLIAALLVIAAWIFFGWKFILGYAIGVAWCVFFRDE